MKSHWNYRVIEFASPDGDPWRAIHEVHYTDGQPTSYSESPAAIGWTLSDGDGAPGRIIDRIREALLKPVLQAHDFTSGRGLD